MFVHLLPRRDITYPPLLRVPHACCAIGDPITVKQVTIASYDPGLQSLKREMQLY